MVEPRYEQEDRAHGRERELEPGIEQRVRVPGEEDDRADEEQMPAVRSASREPGERAERTCHTRAHDGWLSAHGEHVAEDRGKRARFRDEPRDTEKPREHERAAG